MIILVSVRGYKKSISEACDTLCNHTIREIKDESVDAYSLCGVFTMDVLLRSVSSFICLSIDHFTLNLITSLSITSSTTFLTTSTSSTPLSTSSSTTFSTTLTSSKCSSISSETSSTSLLDLESLYLRSLL